MGECGLRGGYFEILGMPEVVKAEILKLASINLCSNTVGQITTGLMVNPPEVGELSHMTYVEERDNILASLKRRAALMSDALNDMEGVSSTTIDGSMYAFPTINLPHKAIEAATKAHMQPDAMYCTELLENTGDSFIIIDIFLYLCLSAWSIWKHMVQIFVTPSFVIFISKYHHHHRHRCCARIGIWSKRGNLSFPDNYFTP
jgi:hypothetical protein